MAALFAQVPELLVRRLRWLLLAGWLLLILSLFLPVFQLPVWMIPGCADSLSGACNLHRQPGNRLFWGVIVPTGVVIIGAISHELWRRICPLAFVSQLGRFLGWQRTRPGKGGRAEVVKVDGDSWLAHHHIQLQWSLLIAGLCLRLLGVNSSPLGLALLLLVTLVAAIAVGWAYGGKAWCQYVCPMGPVQTVLTGLRGPLGSTAHWGAQSRITQSMCRTVAADGREQSACVACRTPCIDIDSERAFWQTMRGVRGLRWAWFSYPGLVLAFFWLMEETVEGSTFTLNTLGYVRSGAWAFDVGLPGRALLPLDAALPGPRLLTIPLVLSLAGWLSVLLFGALETAFQRIYRGRGMSEPDDRALLHTRLMATFLAINSFFWFVDPFQGSLGPAGGQILRSLVLTLTGIALFRSWSRDQASYRRESSSESLRRQLRDLPGLDAALDGRALEALSPAEVFTLVKALPAVGRQQAETLYKGVMAEMLRTGRLERASALLELQDLRQTLGLADADHHAAVRLLAAEEPNLLQNDRLERQRDELRLEAASDAVADLLRQQGLKVLLLDQIPAAMAKHLEQLQQSSGLESDQWQQLLQSFGPQGELERQRLTTLRQRWLDEAHLLLGLRAATVRDSLLRPLEQVMTDRSEGLLRELVQRLQRAGLNPLPDLDTLEAKGYQQQEVLHLLWSDSDPDTAAWVLMLARESDPELAARMLQDSRVGLSDSELLQEVRRSAAALPLEKLRAITASDLFADLTPAGVLWVARQGRLLDLGAGDLLMQAGDPSDSLAVVISGAVQLITSKGQEVVLGPGQSVGEMGVIMARPRTATVRAGADGAQLFLLPASAFESLLDRSTQFSRGLMVQLAERLSRSAP